MGAFLTTLFMIILVLTAGLMTIVILMQKPSANAGMGAALGGGAAESIFGGETANVLLKYTIWIAVAFFVISFGLYLGIISRERPVASNVVLPSELLAPKPAATPGNVTAISGSTDKSSAAAATTAPAPAASTNTPSAVPAATSAPATMSAPATTSASTDTASPASLPSVSK